MKHFIPFLLFLLLGNLSIAAQNTIEGGISVRAGENLTAATVTLENADDAKFNKTIQTDKDGYFIIDNLADGHYRLVATQPAHETIIIKDFVFPRDNEQIIGLTMNPLSDIDDTIVQNSSENNTKRTKVRNFSLVNNN